MNQRIKFEVYDADQNYLENIPVELASDYPAISQEINRGWQDIELKLGYKFDDYPSFIDFNNIIKIYVVNDYYPSGRLIYFGYISDIKPRIDGGEEMVSIRVYPVNSYLSRSFYKDGSSYTVNISAQDPSAAITDVIDHFDNTYPNTVYYDSSIDPVGVNITYDLIDFRWNDAINRIFELVDPNWFYRFDPDGKLHMHEIPATATHTLMIGKHVRFLEPNRTMQDLVNRVRVDYDGGSVVVDNSASITAYGLHEGEPITDTNIKDLTTATQRGTQVVLNQKDPMFSGTLEITGTNLDLLNFNVGETIELVNYDSVNTLLTNNMLITKTTYEYETLTIELGYVRSSMAILLNKFFTYNNRIT